MNKIKSTYRGRFYLFLTLFAFLGTVPNVIAQPCEEEFRRAEGAKESNNYREMINPLENCLRQVGLPIDVKVKAYLWLALAYLELGENPEAEDALEDLLNERPEYEPPEDDPDITDRLKRLLTGVRREMSLISIQPEASPFRFGSVLVDDQSAYRFIEISNIGGAALNVQVVLGGKDPAHFEMSAPTTFTLAGGQSQRVELRFAPRTGGEKQATLRIEHNADNTNVGEPFVMTGIGIEERPPKVIMGVRPRDHNFKLVEVDSTSDPKDFVVSKVGGGVVDIQARIAGKDSSVFGIVAEVDRSMPTGDDSLVVSVVFQPDSVGFKDAQLLILHDAGNEIDTLTVFLKGRGVRPGIRIDLPNSTDFGVIQVDSTSAPLTFPIVNTGDAYLDGEVQLVGRDSTQFRVHGEGRFRLASQQPHEVTVIFAPTSRGSKEAELVITHDAPGAENPFAVSLRGTGGVPRIAELPASLDFGLVRKTRSSDSLRVIILNEGGAHLDGVIQLSGLNTDQFRIVDQGRYRLATQKHREVKVVFIPTLKGVMEAILQVTHDGEDIETPVLIRLRGVGRRKPLWKRWGVRIGAVAVLVAAGGYFRRCGIFNVDCPGTIPRPPGRPSGN